jgi:hypothetical protein
MPRQSPDSTGGVVAHTFSDVSTQLHTATD